MIVHTSISMAVALKRVYDVPSRADGVRVLVDRLWPRGLTKEKATLDAWLKDLAPSDELRRWYHAEPNHWALFRARYLKELAQPDREESLRRLYDLAHGRRRVTLLFASKQQDRNNATVLKELLDGTRKPPRGTGPGAASGARHRKVALRRR